jgi:AraC-like DNA-binding protein
LPKTHKINDLLELRSRIGQLPGVVAMAQLFEPLSEVLFCLKDLQGRYLWANSAFLRRTRVPQRTELIGRRASEIFPALLAAGYDQQDAAIFHGTQDMRDRLEMITDTNGGIGWYLTDKVRIRDPAGHTIALASASRDLRIPVATHPGMAQLADAIATMRQNFAEPLRISQLAAASGMSLSKFERRMTAVLHLSPRQFLTRLRVEAAAERLRTTPQSLARIAVDCGFCDQPTFSRQFKATTGMTGSRYRQLNREASAGEEPPKDGRRRTAVRTQTATS